MEKGNKNRICYREEVEDFLKRRHIKKTLATLVWLRVQKMQGLGVKKDVADTATMEVGVLDEMISEIEKEER